VARSLADSVVEPWWLLGLAALAGFVPFFGVMRFMEKRAARE